MTLIFLLPYKILTTIIIKYLIKRKQHFQLQNLKMKMYKENKLVEQAFMLHLMFHSILILELGCNRYPQPHLPE